MQQGMQLVTGRLQLYPAALPVPCCRRCGLQPANLRLRLLLLLLLLAVVVLLLLLLMLLVLLAVLVRV